jgi:large subunit ribosomal protein L4
MTFERPATSAFQALIDALKIDRSCLVAIRPDNENARRSARNLKDVEVCHAGQLTCFEMLNSRYLVIAKADLEAWIAGPSSRTGKSPARKEEAA